MASMLDFYPPPLVPSDDPFAAARKVLPDIGPMLTVAPPSATQPVQNLGLDIAKWAAKPVTDSMRVLRGEMGEREQQDFLLESLIGLAGPPLGKAGLIGMLAAASERGAGSVARRAAALAMDEASRLARAREMGFDPNLRFYHGTAADFTAFNPEKAVATSGAEPARMGVWAARNPEVAAEFAEMAANNSQAGQRLIPLVHRADKRAVLTLDGSETNQEIAATLGHAWDNGYDAVVMRNYTSPGGRNPEDILVVKGANQLRSPNAAFDPAKKDSGNLLASLAGLGLVGAGISNSDLAKALMAPTPQLTQ
jgi:hypothetical protein